MLLVRKSTVFYFTEAALERTMVQGSSSTVFRPWLSRPCPKDAVRNLGPVEVSNCRAMVCLIGKHTVT